MLDRIIISVKDAPSGVYPATWGQRAMWSCIKYLGDEEPRFFGVRILPVNPAADMAHVAQALGAVLKRHDTLRTIYHHDGDKLWQTVEGAGQLAVSCQSAAPGESAGDVARSIASGLAGEPVAMSGWPLRAAIIQAEGRPVFLVIVYSRIALDHGAAAILFAELRLLLDFGEPDRSYRSPADQSAYENSDSGQAVNAAAMAYWAKTLACGPVSIFDYQERPPATPRFITVSLDSSDVNAALDHAARRMAASSTAIMLAAEAVLLSRYTGHRLIPIQIISSNRYESQMRDVVGTLAWDSLIVLDAGAPTFGEVVRKASQAALIACRHGHYNPEEAWRLRAAEQLRRGGYLDLGSHLNYVSDVRPVGEPVPQTPTATEAGGRRLAGSGGWEMNDARFFLTVRGIGTITRLSLCCDTAYVPAADMRQLLQDLECLLLSLADGDVELDRWGARANCVPAPRGPGWASCGDGWIDEAATERTWATVLGGAPGAIFTTGDQGGPGDYGLVAYLADADDRPLAGLHEAFTRRLGERTDIRAPAWYIRCAAAPERRDSRQAWMRLPVLEQGSGRRSLPGGVTSSDPADRGPLMMATLRASAAAREGR